MVISHGQEASESFGDAGKARRTRWAFRFDDGTVLAIPGIAYVRDDAPPHDAGVAGAETFARELAVLFGWSVAP